MKYIKLVLILGFGFNLSNVFAQTVDDSVTLKVASISSVNTESHGVMTTLEIIESTEEIEGVKVLKDNLLKLKATSKNILDIEWTKGKVVTNSDYLFYIIKKSNIRPGNLSGGQNLNPRPRLGTSIDGGFLGGGGRIIPNNTDGGTGTGGGRIVTPGIMNSNTGILGGSGMVAEEI